MFLRKAQPKTLCLSCCPAKQTNIRPSQGFEANDYKILTFKKHAMKYRYSNYVQIYSQ